MKTVTRFEAQNCTQNLRLPCFFEANNTGIGQAIDDGTISPTSNISLILFLTNEL